VEQAGKGVFAEHPEDAAILGIATGLKIMACPADTFPKVDWMLDPGGDLQFSPRTYAMNSAGSTYGVDIQVDPKNGKYPLPNLQEASRHGVGIYWSSPAANPDWNARGYPTAVVRDPSGTILLCEVASSMHTEGNIWPCTCVGPQTADGAPNGWGNLYQIDTVATQDAVKLSTDGYNEGQQLYKAHSFRFNYAFHDGHVETLKIEDTLGSASGPPLIKIQKPKGMWTVAVGD
jgi:prepilin-type processing-associated H-X9-DG protein